MKDVNSLQELKHLLERSDHPGPGGNQRANGRSSSNLQFDDASSSFKRKRSSNRAIIWADAFAVQTISNHFHICFLIVNEGDRNISSPTVIRSQATRERRNGNGEDEEEEDDSETFVILQLTRRSHYNLIYFNRKALLAKSDVPECVLEKFALHKR